MSQWVDPSRQMDQTGDHGFAALAGFAEFDWTCPFTREVG
jgi:hypothetical protein